MLLSELDHVLADDYLGDLASRPLSEVRSLRDEVTGVEQKISYLRRLVHGRIDIVVGELSRRADGGDPSDLGGLVDGLKDLLAENVHAPGHARMVTRVAPPDVDAVTAELDDALGGVTSFPDLADDQLRALADRLAELNRIYSDRRKALFDRLEVLGGEITRRYGSGEASVESVLK